MMNSSTISTPNLSLHLHLQLQVAPQFLCLSNDEILKILGSPACMVGVFYFTFAVD
jgi:hypothetical protein